MTKFSPMKWRGIVLTEDGVMFMQWGPGRLGCLLCQRQHSTDGWRHLQGSRAHQNQWGYWCSQSHFHNNHCSETRENSKEWMVESVYQSDNLSSIMDVGGLGQNIQMLANYWWLKPGNVWNLLKWNEIHRCIPRHQPSPHHTVIFLKTLPSMFDPLINPVSNLVKLYFQKGATLFPLDVLQVSWGVKY